jgi:hypothetical protein
VEMVERWEGYARVPPIDSAAVRILVYSTIADFYRLNDGWLWLDSVSKSAKTFMADFNIFNARNGHRTLTPPHSPASHAAPHLPAHPGR